MERDGKGSQMNRKLRVWCEYIRDGIEFKEMCGSENRFLLSQTGEVMSLKIKGLNPNAVKDYTKLVPLFNTGLEDKNNEEIYEGDILQDEEVALFAVERNNYIFVRRTPQITNQFNILPDHIQVKIIGNIYENPELLKEKKNE